MASLTVERSDRIDRTSVRFLQIMDKNKSKPDSHVRLNIQAGFRLNYKGHMISVHSRSPFLFSPHTPLDPLWPTLFANNLSKVSI